MCLYVYTSMDIHTHTHTQRCVAAKRKMAWIHTLLFYAVFDRLRIVVSERIYTDSDMIVL